MTSFLRPAEKIWYSQLGDTQEASEMRQRLEMIKTGVIELWASGKVIQNFTDHGIAHDERVLAKLWDIYQQRTSSFSKLSPEEVFVLLASAYLHDVGMQCSDLTLFSKVGAKVVNKVPANYTPDEQTEIRKHHSELSAEMIGWAFDSKLGGQLPKYIAAIKALPGDYITPIKDVVRYHSNDIKKCPKAFLGVKRRQPLALLLRFADELDICHDRININEIKLYPKPLDSEYWWWVHYYTTTIEVLNNRITFHLRLHPRDVENYGNFLKIAVVDVFTRKNEDVVDELSQLGVPLTYALDVPQEIDKHLMPLSDEVKEYINETLRQHAQKTQHQLQRLSIMPSQELFTGYKGFAASRRYRPAMGGDGVAHHFGTVGTICCILADSSGIRYLLSTSNVLVGSESPKRGIPILQPAPLDGGTREKDTIALLEHWVVPKLGKRNHCDAAIARLLDHSFAVPSVRGLGPILGVGEPALGERVFISGRGSGVTSGLVVGTSAYIEIQYPEGIMAFMNAFICTNNNAGGDSGAPVMNEKQQIVGMVIAGSPKTTIAIPISTTLKALQLNVVTSE